MIVFALGAEEVGAVTNMDSVCVGVDRLWLGARRLNRLSNGYTGSTEAGQRS